MNGQENHHWESSHEPDQWKKYFKELSNNIKRLKPWDKRLNLIEYILRQPEKQMSPKKEKKEELEVRPSLNII